MNPPDMTPPDRPRFPESRDLSTLRRADFGECVGDEFTTADEDFVLRLRQAESFGSRVDPQSGRPFSCIFKGPDEPVLAQGIVDLRHPRLGSLSIFLVPIGPAADGMQYEAVFT